MERNEFVAEGRLEVGPPGWFFVFLDGEYLGKRLVDNFQPPEERRVYTRRVYTDLGRVRVTVELLEPTARDNPHAGSQGFSA